MAEKVLNSRIINKHDIAANWELAVNFIPKSGEIIVYEPDNATPYARLKVGDGTTRVNDLDFLSEEEFAALRNDLTALSELVGDTSVAEQIEAAQYILPIATSTTLGGVKPVVKTEEMTQAVGVDAEGRLFTDALEVITNEEIDTIVGSSFITGYEVRL